MTPRLSIGLPVYNGEAFLEQALNDLLGQTWTDFELIIADNASTDRTQEICRTYVQADPRIRYLRHSRNIGAGPNHNFVFTVARGELFKWASHDDLYAPQLIEKCIAFLDANPDAVLAHTHEVYIDEHEGVLEPVTYDLDTASTNPVRRFRSLLFDDGGDDFYGVIRADMLRLVRPHDSFHHADRVFVAEMAMHGRFLQVPDQLYFRRDHPQRAERSPSIRLRAANLDPRRRDPWRHPVLRLLGEYVVGYVAALRRSPLTRRQRLACYGYLLLWLISRLAVSRKRRNRRSVDPAVRANAMAA